VAPAYAAALAVESSGMTALVTRTHRGLALVADSAAAMFLAATGGTAGVAAVAAETAEVRMRFSGGASGATAALAALEASSARFGATTTTPAGPAAGSIPTGNNPLGVGVELTGALAVG
jgi:hypothetical protein